MCPPPEQSLQAAKAFSSPLGAAPNNVDIVDGVCILQNKSTKQDAQNRKCYDDAIKFYQFTLQVSWYATATRLSAAASTACTRAQSPAVVSLQPLAGCAL